MTVIYISCVWSYEIITYPLKSVRGRPRKKNISVGRRKTIIHIDGE